MLKLPTHSLDRDSVYIDVLDPAWDTDRVSEEREAMEAAGEDPSEHPVTVYFSGASRYDLDAPRQVGDKTLTPRDYLTEPGTEFTLARMGWKKFRRVRAKLLSGDPEQVAEAEERSVEWGVEEISDKALDRLKPAALMERLSTDPDLIGRIASAVITANMPLSESELKA